MATKTAKKATAKKDIQDNVTKIKETAKSVGTQVKNTADVLLDDVKKNTTELRDAAKKMNMTSSLETIQKTAMNVNKEVLTTATSIVEDVYENGKQFTDVAIKTAKETISKIDLAEGVKMIGTTAKSVNEYGLKTADTMLDEALVNGEKWQNVTAKAVKGGLKLAERQQDMVFTALETVKTQMVTNVKRFRGLFSQN